MLDICLVTDVHIEYQQDVVSEVNTVENFLKMMGIIASKPYDLLIIAGDICNTSGYMDTYLWVKEQLDTLPFPYVVIAGNHDDSAMMAKAFAMEILSSQNELYYQIKLKGETMLFLDSSLGFMSDDQWIWLENRIKELQTSVNIVMHHPPLASGVKHLEPKYAFTQMDRFIELCQKYHDKKFLVFAGHYHMERTISFNNLQVCITPSTFLQIDPDQEDLVTIKDWMGYRELRLEDGLCTMTRIVVCK